jgi:hypothetical protein
MADNAQANRNDVHLICGSGDASISIENQEVTCLFHCT